MYIKLKKSVRRAACLLLLTGTAAQAREWTDRQGNRFEAEYRRELFGTVFFETPEGKKISIDTVNLSTEDVDYIRTQIPPEVEIDFSKSERNKELSIYARPDDSVTLITATVDIEQVSRAPFYGKLTVEIYLLSEEVATEDYRIVAKKTAAVEFTEENGGQDVITIQTEVRRYLEYNRRIRGAEYCGYAVLVFGPHGDRVAWSTDLDWLREDDLPLLRELRQGKFLDENCWEMPVPRPEYYVERADWSQ